MDRRLIDALMEAVVPVIRERDAALIARIEALDAALIARIEALDAALIARIEALEARPAPERGEKGDKGDAGEKGDKGDVGDKGEQGDRGEKGDAGEKGDKGDAGAPGEKGDTGDRGERGADAPAVTKEQVIEAVLAMEDGIDYAVKTYLGQNPPADGINGKDGDPGEKGDRGDKGEPGRDGRDGLPGVQGEKGIDGINGKDGRDGLSLEDFDLEIAEDGRTLVMKLARGETVIKREIVLPIPLDRGVWKDLTDYVRGDGVTHDGSFWIAQRETQTRPGMPGSDWRLAVKKGQNGKDLRDEQRTAAPVRFK